MNARTMTISRVCGGILAVFFALSFAAENANAQTATSCERSRVYTPSNDSYGIPGRTLTWNISGTLGDIAAEIRGFPFFFNSHLYFLFGENPDRINDRSDGYGSGTRPLPQIPDGSRDARQGDIITIQDLNATPAFSKAYRVYLNDASAVALADGQETEILKCEEHLVATRNEFFLDSGWVQTATAASGNSGHDTLTCPTGMVIPANPPAEGDNSACVVGMSQAEICLGMMQVEDTVNGGCRSCGDKRTSDGTNCDIETADSCRMMDTPQIVDGNDGCMSCGVKSTSDGTSCDLETADSCRMMDTPQIVDANGRCESCPDPDSQTTTDGMMCECKSNFNDDETPGTCVPNTVQEQCDSATEEPNGELGCQCKTGFNDEANPGNCVADNVQTPQTQTAPARTESDVQDNAIVGLGGAAAVGVAAYFLSGGNFGLFAATPDFGYSLTESGYSVNAGGRVDFRKNRWHLYWTAGQQSVNGDFGDFRYSSGGEYKADFWTAAFSEKVQGDVVDYDVSLSANYGESVWQISPVYRLHSRFEEEEDGGLESETTNSLNLEGVLRYHRWTVRPSAGFQWREMDDFADNARFGISAVRNL